MVQKTAIKPSEISANALPHCWALLLLTDVHSHALHHLDVVWIGRHPLHPRHRQTARVSETKPVIL